MIVHPISPIYNEKSKILILGSFPSVKSREEGFFYSHPRNRFWRIISKICNAPVPLSVEEKINLILDNHFALWDVIHSCEITGSADSTIKNAVPNDLQLIIDNSQIEKIFVNGKKAYSLYEKYIEKQTGISAVCLPSTSPANAGWNDDRLCKYWKEQIGI